MQKPFYINELELDEYSLRFLYRHLKKQNVLLKGPRYSGKIIFLTWKAAQIKNSNYSFFLVVKNKTIKEFNKECYESLGLENNVVTIEEWEKLNNKIADFILVDDAEEIEIEILNEIKNNCKLGMYITANIETNIYTTITPNLWKFVVENNFITETLIFNHGTPKKVARLAEKISNTDDELELRCVNEGVELPKILEYPNLNAQLDSIIEIIKNPQLEDVAILAYTNNEVQFLKNFFSKINLFDSDLDYFISSFDEVTGLSFESVIIFGSNKNNDNYRIELYNAILTTRQNLFILHSDGMPNFLKSIPSELYETKIYNKQIKRL